MKYYVALLGFWLLTNFSFAQIPCNNLQLHYPFNGNSNDKSGNGHHDTNTGAPARLIVLAIPTARITLNEQSSIGVHVRR